MFPGCLSSASSGQMTFQPDRKAIYLRQNLFNASKGSQRRVLKKHHDILVLETIDRMTSITRHAQLFFFGAESPTASPLTNQSVDNVSRGSGFDQIRNHSSSEKLPVDLQFMIRRAAPFLATPKLIYLKPRNQYNNVLGPRKFL